MENRKRLIMLIAAFASVYTIWGSTYLAIRFAIETAPPFLMAGIRFLIAGSILFLVVKRKSHTPIEPVHWKSSFIIGGFLLLGGNGGVVWAEQFIPSGLTAVLIATVPIWVVIINLLNRKGEKLSLKTIIGVVLGFAGLIFLINPFNVSGEKVNLIGVLVILIASLSWALGSVYTKHAVLHKSKLIAVSMQMLAGGLLLSIAGLLTGEFAELDISGISLKSSLAILYLILFGSIIGFTSYIWLIEAAGTARASTYAYVNPVVAVFLGWLLANEIINLRIISATVIIIAAVAIINSNFNFMNIRRRKFSKKRSTNKIDLSFDDVEKVKKETPGK